MAVFISGSCINCSICAALCPTQAIVDFKNNPKNINTFYVIKNLCCECIGYYPTPICASKCPVKECIKWDFIDEGCTQLYKREKEVPLLQRVLKKPVLP